MNLFTVNNKKEAKFLRTKTKEFDFSKYSKKEVRDLVNSMRKIMKKEQGIGLAANQVGLNFKMFITQHEDKFYAIFNPKIEKTFGKKALFEEGCLSVPEKFGLIERYEKITLSAFNQSGKKIKIKAWGLLAQVFQHETDHLNGKIYIDKAKKVLDIEELIKEQ